MDNVITWFLKKEHWLIVIGIILAILGAFYNAYGLDQGRKFFGGLTQGLSFGLVGGGILGLGLGLISFLLSVIATFITDLEISYISIIIAFILTGFILGLIFGFLIGFSLNNLGQTSLSQKKANLVKYVASTLIFALSITIQFALFSVDNHFNQVILTNFLNVPLFGGFLSGFMFKDIVL